MLKGCLLIQAVQYARALEIEFGAAFGYEDCICFFTAAFHGWSMLQPQLPEIADAGIETHRGLAMVARVLELKQQGNVVLRMKHENNGVYIIEWRRDWETPLATPNSPEVPLPTPEARSAGNDLDRPVATGQTPV